MPSPLVLRRAVLGGQTTALRPPVTADQSLAFGALTKAGAGGYVIPYSGRSVISGAITAGDASDHWEISVSGGVAKLVPTSAGDTADLSGGPYSLTYTLTNLDGTSEAKTLTVATSGTINSDVDLSSTASVSSVTELMALAELGTSYSGAGITVAMRGGSYDTRSENWSNRLGGISSGTLRFTSHDHADRAVWSGAVIPTNNVSDIRWDHLVFFMEWVQSSAQGAGVLDLTGTGASDIRIDHNVFVSNIPKGREWGPDLMSDAALAYHPARPFITALTFGAPAADVEIDHNICYGMTHFSTLYGSTSGSMGVHQHDNHVYWLWGDLVHPLAYDGGTKSGKMLIENDMFHDPVGNGFFLHPDVVQSYKSGSHTGGDLGPVTVRGLIAFMGYEGVRVPPGIAYPPSNGSVVDDDYTVPAESNTQAVLVDASGGPITVTLPAAGSYNVTVEKIDDSENAVTVQRAGSDTITDEYAGSGLTEITLSRRWQALEFAPSGSVWTTVREGPSLQFGLFQGIGSYDYVDWLVEGCITWIPTVHGLTMQFTGTGMRFRNNTLLRIWPGDVNGDGNTDESDSFYEGARPSIILVGTNNLAYRNVVGGQSGSTHTENFLLASPTLSDYTDQFVGTEESDFAPVLDEGDYHVLADDGYADIENFETRFQSLREEIAAYALAASGSDIATGGQGALGTTLTNGFYDVESGTRNHDARLMVDLTYDAPDATEYDIELNADVPGTWTIQGGADSSEYSISDTTLTLAAQDYSTPDDDDTDGTYEVTVRHTDWEGNTTDFAIETTILEPSTPTATYLGATDDGTNKAAGAAYTFSSKTLGTPNADRLIIIGVATTQPVSSVTIGGVTATEVIHNTEFGHNYIFQAAVPTGSTGDIVVTIDAGASTNARIAIGWAACYPASTTALGSGSDYISTPIVENLEIADGGFVFAFGMGGTPIDPISFSWSGADTITLNVTDTTTEAGWAYGVGSFIATESITTGDLTATPTSGAMVLIGASWGAPT